MGLFDRGNGSVYLTGGPSTNLTENDSVAGKSTIQATTVSLQTLPNDELSATDDVKSTLDPSQSVRSTGRRSTFERELMIVSDGYLGKILLVDEAAMGSLATNQDTGIPEYVVGDALATISILDIKWLFGNKKKLLIG
ncbi:hypothetical protein Poli38472_009274 [Pythium oligandrum]|uniref:Uncharacterized protein n=1 Tax=Pythium oligandrum TaxID=41045 RepID=A0A8K1CKF7_PYTOL|nr:hypothetical protein Poli38472_009274 [Pythium oligandrum]|eukprot:TMW65107.1 hypothetical protein Poli38472_009274 [Pythium oligandrum]